MESLEHEIHFSIQEVDASMADELKMLRLKTDEDCDLVKLDREVQKYIEDNDRIAFISREGDVVIGFVEAKLTDELPAGSPPIDGISDFAELARIGVLSEYRRKGIAKQLMQRAEEWARQSGKYGMWLDYLVTNESAANLYENNGYAVAAEFMDPKKNKMRKVGVKKF